MTMKSNEHPDRFKKLEEPFSPEESKEQREFKTKRLLELRKRIEGSKQNPSPPPVIKQTPILERRIGRFRVPQEMLLEPHTGRAIFREMIVMRAEANFVDGTLMVWADHPQFDILTPGTMVSEYVATITAPKGIPPRRHQDLVVQWKLADLGDQHSVSLVARMAREDSK